MFVFGPGLDKCVGGGVDRGGGVGVGGGFAGGACGEGVQAHCAAGVVGVVGDQGVAMEQPQDAPGLPGGDGSGVGGAGG